MYNELLQDSYLTRNVSPIQNYHTRQSEIEYRSAFRNNWLLAAAELRRLILSAAVRVTEFSSVQLMCCEHALTVCSGGGGVHDGTFRGQVPGGTKCPIHSYGRAYPAPLCRRTDGRIVFSREDVDRTRYAGNAGERERAKRDTKLLATRETEMPRRGVAWETNDVRRSAAFS